MSLQHAAVELLDYASSVLMGLADHGQLNGSDLRFVSAKMAEASKRLKVEPLTLDDIRASRDTLGIGRASMRRLYDQKLSGPDRGWLMAAVESWNAVIDLYDGMEAFHQVVKLDVPELRSMGHRLRKLLPAGWWGSR